MNRTAVDYDPFAAGELSRVVPTTESQRELWLASYEGDEASLAFNESLCLQMRGALDVAALDTALQALVSRHDALRASFGPDGEVFCVHQASAFTLSIHDLSGLAPVDRESHVQRSLRHAVDTPFEFGSGRMFVADLLRLDTEDHLLVMSGHHIVVDGWSWWVILRELGVLYTQRREGKPFSLPPVQSYADYALQEIARAGSAEARADEAYWVSRFADRVPVLELPTDRPRPTVRSYASLREDLVLDAGLLEAVRRSGAKRGASLFATLLGGFAGLLSRLTGQEDVVIGIPAAGQSVDGQDQLVGHCVNLLPLRFRMDPSLSFGGVLAQAQETLLDALEHQRYTFGTLLKQLKLGRDPARLPLVSVMFNIDQAMESEKSGFGGLQIELATNPRTHENFELFVNAVQENGGLRLECQYNSDLFDAASIRRWLSSYESLLRAAAADSDITVAQLPLLDATSRTELAGLQPAAVGFDRDCAMHEHFERQCDRDPDRIAVRSGSECLSYAALESRANRIAHLLRSQGIQNGSLVGLAMDRGIDMLAGMLGILKAGAGYVPLDPQFPVERLVYMAGDARLAALLTQEKHAPGFSLQALPILLLDKLGQGLESQPDTRIGRDAHAAQAESVAYVIYTSGSTGRPKGVQVPHRAVANFLPSMAREPGLHAGDILLAVTTLSFDIAVLELMLPLSVGAQVLLAQKDDVVDGFALKQLLEQHAVTAMQATPATWRMLVESDWQGNADFKCLCGGEPLPPDLAMQLLPRSGQLWNLYGPTETTVWSTCMRVIPPASGAVPDIHIGRPIDNTQVWILDEQQQLCAPGVSGEICIGGEGVTLGYLDRAELTADRFVADSFGAQSAASPSSAKRLLYRTGDLGRWRVDGNLEHLGRLDFQVKVRGFRIELGEIENVIASHPSVARVVVLAREDRPGDVRLVAYVVASTEAVFEESSLVAHARTLLPGYMLPQHIVRLDAMPLLPNGKMDRNALAAPNAGNGQALGTADAAAHGVAAVDSDALDDPRVEYLAAVWSEMLGMQAGPADNFFELGGHSMLAVQMANRVAKDTGVRFRLMSIATQTLAQAASTLPEASVAAATESLPAIAGTPGDATDGVGSKVFRYLGSLFRKPEAGA